MRKPTNQKLSNEQIATIKHLKSNGVKLSLIAKVLHQSYGLSLSAAYYHLSDNQDSYNNTARKIRDAQLQKTKQKIYLLIQQGYTTSDIADEWNMELATVNKIYIR